MNLFFHKTLDDGHREGMLKFTGFGDGGALCRDAKNGTTTLELKGDALVIELRAKVGDVPADARGMCSTAGTDGLVDKPCSERTVLRAKAHAPL